MLTTDSTSNESPKVRPSMPNAHLSLHIDTNDLGAEDDSVPSAPNTRFSARLVTPSTRERAISFSHGVLPSLRISTAANSEKHSASQNIASIAISQGSDRAKNESRKLLAHLLDQLQRRPMPSSLDNSYGQTRGGGRRIGAVVRSVKKAVSNKDSLDGRRPSVSDDEDEDLLREEADFYTDVTFDLMSQLKDVFLVASAQGWNIFVEHGEASNPNKRNSGGRASSFLRRRSMQTGRRRSRSRSSSPNRDGPVKAPELLSQCISVLSSVVMVDCQYQVASPRPFRPPNALQAVTLDIAQFLIHSHQGNPEVVSKIGFAMVYAFHTFKQSMHARLLAFFDENVLGELLERLGRIQKRADSLPTADMSFEDSSADPPMVSIMVDEAKDDVKSPTSHGTWSRWSSLKSPLEHAHRSTNAPEQELAVYYLSSLISPLLAAIVENVDFFSNNLPTIYRLHLFLDRLVARKPDVYLDLLAVIAYHPARARHSAISLLMSFWSKAVGHVIVTKPFPDVSYAETVARIADRGTVTGRQPSNHDQSHPYAHQFVPWRFLSSSKPLLYEGASHNECRVCSKHIQGFGLSCPFCMCSVHFDCYDYPDGSFLAQYAPVASEPDVQKVAVHRFCHTQPPTRNTGCRTIRKEQHTFRPVNIFSLTLCFICRRPLWGCVRQGLKCNTCKHFIHSSCLANASPSILGRCRSVPIDSTHMFIEWSILRRSFAEHYRELLLIEADLRQQTYEELAVIGSVLWTQLQIMDNGIALGSIVVQGDSASTDQTTLEHFELHYLVSSCEALLASNELSVSGALVDYLAENQARTGEYSMFFDWNTLAYIASILKLPPEPNKVSTSGSSDLLSAGHPAHFDEVDDDSSHPMEIVPLAHVRDQLGDCFSVFSDAAARHLLSHLYHLGLLQPVSQKEEHFERFTDPKNSLCCFPLPFGFDVSADIETLVAAIEACLLDLDLSINETGFLLLTRRFWPDGMLSDYTFRRLTKAILVWIFSEDDNLATILRDFVARGRTLPGVRVGLDNQPWPNQNHSRPTAANSASNGGDYVASRRALLQRYVAPWLLAFHDQDISAYAIMIYDILTEHAEGDYTDDYLLRGQLEVEQKKRRAASSDRVLRLITKICQASVVFTAFDGLFKRWLQRAHVLDNFEPSMSLPRLFNREMEANQRYSTMVDTRMTVQDLSALSDANPLRDLMDTAKGSSEGFSKGLYWLCLFVSSGVDVPASAFLQFASLARRFKANLGSCSMLAKATLWSCWLKSMGRQELQAVMSALHAHLAQEILENLYAQRVVDDVICFIRQSLAACLLLYGCDRSGLIDLGMVQENEVEHLPSRRKIQTRASAITDPIIVDPDLINSLKSYVQVAVDEVSRLVAKFFNAFVNESPLVESYEVDNFILRNGPTLCACAWQFYGMELSAVCTIRTSFLLRVLVVDAQPFQALIAEFLESGDWEARLHTAHCLFRIISDVTSPAFSVEDRQWRPSVIDIFHYFFSSLWLDSKEEVRMAVETWSQTLLPAHFEAVALCWNEALNKVPVAERVKLVSFLTQLRTHFPQWRVLGWDAIMESLLENDFMQRNGDNEDGPASTHLSMYGLSDRRASTAMQTDSDLVLLQVSLVSLSLRMIADDLSIEIPSILKLKSHTLSLLGYRNVSLVPSGSGHSFYVKFNELGEIPSWSYPCLSDLMLVLDSPHALLVAPSAMDSPYADDDAASRLPIGSVFTDLLLDVFAHYQGLTSLPPMTLKNLLKALIIVLYKHDFDSKPLRHLQANLRRAVRRTLDLLLDPASLSYELRQLCLTICQAFIKVWPNIAGVFLCEAIEAATKLMVSLHYEQNVDDPLVGQTRGFLETNFIMFSGSGIVNALFKRRLDADFFAILRFIVDTPTTASSSSSSRARLGETLLRDALSRAADNDAESFQLVLDNISKYVEIVYHSRYSPDLLQFVGHSITAIARKTADWPSNSFDASPLLLLASTLIQFNKAQIREFLTLVEGFLRVALVRSYLSAQSLTQILQVTTSLYRKAGTPEQSLVLNHVALFILEQLTDKLNHKAHITSATLIQLLEVFTAGSGKELPLRLSFERSVTLADAGFAYLHAEGIGMLSQTDFAASQAVANMVMQVAEDQPQVLSTVTRSHTPVRAWNLILLAAISSNSTAAAAILFEYFPNFSLVYYRTLSAYEQHNYDGAQEVAHVDISRAYASIKLWLLLSRKATAIQEVSVAQSSVSSLDKESTLTRMVWNDLWPPFESVVGAIESDPQASSQLALISTLSSSVADLFLFLRQFRCVVALETSSQTALLNRLRTLGRSDAKVSRVLHQLTEPPGDMSLDYLVQQAMTEIWAEEKLEAAKREEVMKNPSEKSRTRVVS